MKKTNGLTVAYIRVSSQEQNLARQEELASRADKVFSEKRSGKRGGDRPELRKVIEYVREGDTLIVSSIDRLARSIVDLNEIVSELREKGVTVEFEHERMRFDPDVEIDPYSEAMFNMLGTFAQFQRKIILQQQLEGIAVAKAEGKYRGQKPKLTDAQVATVRERVAAKVPKAEIARDLGISRKTIYRALEPNYVSIEEWKAAA